MNIHKESLESFRKEFREAMKPLEEKFGLTISLGNIRYDVNNFHTKLTCVNPTTASQESDDAVSAPYGKAEEFEKRAFEADCGWFGFAKEDYLLPLRDKGKGYLLVGFSTKAKKNVCKIRAESGKEYVTSSDWVKSHKALFGVYTCTPTPIMELHTRKIGEENADMLAAEHNQE